MNKWFCACLFVCTTGVALPALACGICIEDKMALTYDYNVAQQTFARGQVLVFCELSGRVNTLDRNKVIDDVRRLLGIPAESIRMSSQPTTLSFALNPAVQSVASAVHVLQQAMPKGVTIALLNTMTGKR